MVGYRKDRNGVLEDRKQAFIDCGLPVLKDFGFEPPPFSVGMFKGKTNLGGYAYQYCRLEEGILEVVRVSISSRDDRIKLFLNRFSLAPRPNSLSELDGLDGGEFGNSPNKQTEVELGEDLLFGIYRPDSKLRIGRYYTIAQYEKKLSKLRDNVRNKVQLIPTFIAKWNQTHQPRVTDWEGRSTS